MRRPVHVDPLLRAALQPRNAMPHGINVLTLRGAQIEEITAFLTPDVFRRFRLPDALLT